MSESIVTWCADCLREQPDPMRHRGTCIHCGCSPVPSRAYGKEAGALYPHKPVAEDFVKPRKQARKPAPVIAQPVTVANGKCPNCGGESDRGNHKPYCWSCGNAKARGLTDVYARRSRLKDSPSKGT